MHTKQQQRTGIKCMCRIVCQHNINKLFPLLEDTKVNNLCHVPAGVHWDIGIWYSIYFTRKFWCESFLPSLVHILEWILPAVWLEYRLDSARHDTNQLQQNYSFQWTPTHSRGDESNPNQRSSVNDPKSFAPILINFGYTLKNPCKFIR